MPYRSRGRRTPLAAAVLCLGAVAVAGCGARATQREPDQVAHASSSPTPTPRTVTMVMNGDVLLHEGLWSTARIDAARTGRGDMDFRPLLADMRPVISGADLAICHLETPLAPAGGPYQGYPLFSAPPSIAPALRWAGYDACTTSSNHSVDQGYAGLARTISVMHAAGIETTGTATTRAAAGEPLILDAHGVRVALIAATYGTNGMPLPEGKPWAVSLIDADRIKAQAARAKAEGADIVLVALHWGAEYQHAPTPEQIALADNLTRSPDIDLLYGHHGHVVQPIEKVNGKWVAFGLGNAVAQQDPTVDGVFDGVTIRVTFAEQSSGHFVVGKLEYLPTMITHWIPGTTMRWLDVPRSLANPARSSRYAELRATRARVRGIVGDLGAFDQGLVALR